MMKKIAALALSLALIPSAVFADQIFNIPFGQSFQSGIYLPTVTSGQCLTTTGAMSKVVGLTCGTGIVQSVTAGTGVTVTGTTANPIINATGGGGGGVAFIPLEAADGLNFVPQSAGALTTSAFTASNFYDSALGTSIGHLDVACANYVPANIPYSTPYTTLAADGLGGGTITFAITNPTYPMTSPLVLGTVVIPTSPQAGPWVTNVSSAVGTPYTLLSGDSVIISVSAVATTAQVVMQCMPFIGP